MATITLRLPDELDEALERQSTAAGVSKSDLAREALRRFLAVSEFQKIREKLVRRAQAQGIHTDDDVFGVLNRR
ncbi:MAG: ribbon-helix-helix protein, CopG family [Gammaproteobacteria bacterium]|nr:ribbon-helix-helix protein, CopG family [Gammaproteobacteria bacterium]MBV8308179.1 ribbon-helix-helix protein, CopG family [Gammaproteobacteria bacterium]MBV8404195.1 ribbon-helix-helix protein, CopG family [Gammaproteobacteria bacterium]